MTDIPTRRLGSTGIEVTVLGLGGAPLGDLYEQVAEDDAQASIEAALDGGVAYVDTAPLYGHGLSEHRLGHRLRRRARSGFVLSTKVGRVYRRPDHPASFEIIAPWAGGLPFDMRFDYTRTGVMRSFEDSLMRLGLNRIDMLVIHDLDAGYHGDDGVTRRLDELERGGGFAALAELKASGVIRGIGAGINKMPMIDRFLERFNVDMFLVAMPYTLLDQEPLDGVFARCAERGVGIVIGAPYASGILATGAVAGAKYRYAEAPADILDKTRRIEAVCTDHGIELGTAALQFPLGHPIVAAVIPGAISAAQVRSNIERIKAPVPSDFWAELKALGLIHLEAPTPG